jgi:prephenate dehydratase
MNTISFQGIEGSFHHEVAVGYFGQDHKWLGRDHFGEVFDDVANDRADFGVVAIENSNVGTIVGNLDHFDRGDLQIVAEVYLSVQQCLLDSPRCYNGYHYRSSEPPYGTGSMSRVSAQPFSLGSNRSR